MIIRESDKFEMKVINQMSIDDIYSDIEKNYNEIIKCISEEDIKYDRMILCNAEPGLTLKNKFKFIVKNLMGLPVFDYFIRYFFYMIKFPKIIKGLNDRMLYCEKLINSVNIKIKKMKMDEYDYIDNNAPNLEEIYESSSIKNEKIDIANIFNDYKNNYVYYSSKFNINNMNVICLSKMNNSIDKYYCTDNVEHLNELNIFEHLSKSSKDRHMCIIISNLFYSRKIADSIIFLNKVKDIITNGLLIIEESNSYNPDIKAYLNNNHFPMGSDVMSEIVKEIFSDNIKEVFLKPVSLKKVFHDDKMNYLIHSIIIEV